MEQIGIREDYKDGKLIKTVEYDDHGNMIHCKSSDGVEEWWEYDKNGNMLHSKDSNGFERWWEYDKDSNMIHIKDSDGFEWMGGDMM